MRCSISSLDNEENAFCSNENAIFLACSHFFVPSFVGKIIFFRLSFAGLVCLIRLFFSILFTSSAILFGSVNNKLARSFWQIGLSLISCTHLRTEY